MLTNIENVAYDGGIFYSSGYYLSIESFFQCKKCRNNFLQMSESKCYPFMDNIL